MSASTVTTVTVTVYRMGRRRYFSRYAAFDACARARIKARCDCEPGENGGIGYGYPGYACRYHADEAHYAALVHRLARWLKRQSRPSLPLPPESHD